MKKALLWVVILLISISMIGVFSLAGCKKAAEEVTAPVEEKEEVVEETAPPEEEVTEEEAEEITLTLAMWGSEEDVEVYKKRVDLAKEKYPNITVEVIYIPSEYDQKVQTMIAGGTSPDIIQLAEQIHAYSSKGQIISLNEYVEASGIDLNERYGSVHKVYSTGGELYAMPDRGGAMIVYYNKDLFDEAGVSYPTKDWTWDDLLDAAKKLTIKEGDEVKQWGFAAGSWWPWWMSFMYQNGGRVLDENNKPVVNTPENVEALQFYNDLVWKYNVAPSPVDYANMGVGSPDTIFAQGIVAFQITGFWNIASLNKVPELNWDIAPVWKNKERATPIFGSGLAISKDCKNPEAAFKIIEFMTSEEGQMPIVEMVQDAPANLSVLGSDAFLKAAWSEKEINMNTFAESADAIFVPPLVPEWNEIQKIFDDNLAGVFMNERSVEEALEQIQAELEDLLS